MNKKLLIKVLMCMVFFLGLGGSSYAQFLINENFRGKTTDAKNSIIMGGEPVSSFLTASKTDSDGEGWIRLNADIQNHKGFFYVNQAFPSENGVFVDFEYKTWRSEMYGYDKYTDGDGIGVFLFDGSVNEKNFALGGYGGSLGYAPMKNTKGLNGGYIGLGIDEYGNYSSTADGKHGNTPSKERQFEHRLALRGMTDRSLASDLSNLLLYSKPLIIGTHGADKVGYTKVTKTRPSDGDFYRRVQIEINPLKDSKEKVIGSTVIVRWALEKGGKFYDVMNEKYEKIPPKSLKIGFAASTGGAINNHEVRDLFATTPGGVMIEKVADKTLVNEGDELTYTINLKGQNAQAFDFKFTDDFKLIEDYFTVNSITVNTYSNTGNKVTLPTNAKNLKDVAVTLARLGTISFTIKGKVIKAPNGNILKNKTFIDRATLETALKAGKIGFIDDTKISSEVSTIVVDDNYCGCPPGSIELKSNNNDLTILKSGNIYCVSGIVDMKSITIEKDAYLYVQSGARLNITGQYTQEGGIVSVCPKGGIYTFGGVTFGKNGLNAEIVLKKNSFFSVSGSFIQPDTGSSNKAVIKQSEGSFVEVCATYTQYQNYYPVVEYVGRKNSKAYFINKTSATGLGESTIISNNPEIVWITMNNKANISAGKASWCGEFATEKTCKDWPTGLRPYTPGECNTVAELVDRPAFEVIKSGVYTGTLPVKLNDIINYTITVKNTGNVELYDLKVVDAKIDVNEVIRLLDIEESKVVKGSYKIAQEDIDRGGVFNQALGTVKTPEGKEIKVRSVDPKPLSPTDPKYPLPDPNYPNCTTCTVTTLERNPSIALVKTGVVDEDAVSSQGNGVINYTFTIKNTGNVSLTLKDFTDSKIPSFKPTGVVLGAGQTWTGTATYEITDGDTDLETVVNTATVNGVPPKGNPVKAEGTSTLKVEGGGPVMTNPHIYHKVE